MNREEFEKQYGQKLPEHHFMNHSDKMPIIIQKIEKKIEEHAPVTMTINKNNQME